VVSRMDLNYSYSLVSFTVGTLSGFQFIAEKYRKAPFRAAWTRAGVGYLIVRGFVASIAFLTLYVSSVVEKRLVVWALVTGVSAELLLRTKIFIREKPGLGGTPEDVMLGPLNLLVWFQNFFLDSIKEQLKISQAKARRDRLSEVLPKNWTGE
jgi:hypothetical protein